jgi:hypothetical protein
VIRIFKTPELDRCPGSLSFRAHEITRKNVFGLGIKQLFWKSPELGPIYPVSPAIAHPFSIRPPPAAFQGRE